jgi:hypothetical protein
MLVEHVFVTTLEPQVALGLASRMLNLLGFYVTSGHGGTLHATRGAKSARTRKVAKLPQTVEITYDRGRVTVVAGILPRAGKDLPVHANLMTNIAQALEDVLVAGELPEHCANRCRVVELQAGSIWSTSDKVLIGILVALIGAFLIGFAMGIAASLSR